MVKNKYRDLEEIHDKSEGGITSRDNVFMLKYNKANKDRLGRSGWNNYGCCSFLKYRQSVSNYGEDNHKADPATHGIIKLPLKHIPSNFRNPKFLLNYCKFFNNLISGKNIEIRYLGIGKINKNGYRAYIDVNLPKMEENCLYMGMKFNDEYPVLNLAMLSFIRYLTFSSYWFLVHDIMVLRNNPELSHLTNLEIYQLASYSTVSFGDKTTNSHGPWYYKSPIRTPEVARYIESDEKVVFKKLSHVNGAILNNLFIAVNKYLPYRVEYFYKLFREKRYLDIYNKSREEYTQGSGKLTSKDASKRKFKMVYTDETSLRACTKENIPYEEIIQKPKK